MTRDPNNYLSQLLSAVGDPRSPSQSTQPNTLSSLFNQAPSAPTGLFGNAFLGNHQATSLSNLLETKPTTNSSSGIFGARPQTTAPISPNELAPRIRRVFYSFHYADVNRVNQVRQSGKIRPIDSERVKTVQDRSLWERKKSINEEYLRRSIARNISGTSVTCVLAGEQTWARPWCRFEIARSLLNGNGIFAVRIHHLYCIGQRCFGNIGPNPLDFIGVGRDDKGRFYVYEFTDGGWYKMSTMTSQLLRWPRWLEPVQPGYVRQLSSGAPIYDYDTGNGARFLLLWANQAAKAAGR